MTGRRPRPGPEMRLSRAMQFVPGHVGGRVASAQPVKRNGGTLRRPAVGAVAALPSTGGTVVLRPDAISQYGDAIPIVYGGSAGSATLSDDVDSTYVQVSTISGTGTSSPCVEFEAASLPTDATITDVSVSVRVKSDAGGLYDPPNDSYDDMQWNWYLFHFVDGHFYSNTADRLGEAAVYGLLTDTWANHSLTVSDYDSSGTWVEVTPTTGYYVKSWRLPTVAELNAGEVRLYNYVGIGADSYYYIAEASLSVTWTP